MASLALIYPSEYIGSALFPAAMHRFPALPFPPAALSAIPAGINLNTYYFLFFSPVLL